MTTARIRLCLAVAGVAVTAVSLPTHAAYVAESRDALHVAAAAVRDQLAATGETGSFAAVGGVSEAPDAGALAPTVAAPVPEPESYALMLAGLGVVGWAVRRRSR